MDCVCQKIYNFSLIFIGIIFLNFYSFSREANCDTISALAKRCEGYLDDYNKRVEKTKKDHLKHKTELEDYIDAPSYEKYLNEANISFSKKLANEKKDLTDLFNLIIVLSDGYESLKDCDVSKKKIGKCFIEYYKIVSPNSSDQPSSDLTNGLRSQ